jgi:fermentation-respiration switch protein FrsA (DUF1100 family)
MTFPPRGVKLAAAGALLGLGGCAVHGPLLAGEAAVDERILSIELHGQPVAVHLAALRGPASGAPLIFYVTGDGGWRGADPLVFRALVRWGYPAVGLEASDYLDHLTQASHRGARHLAHDYRAIIARAEGLLGLAPATSTVLVGFSRGAALAVIAAGQRSLRPHLAGVVAVALIDEEGTVEPDEGPHGPPLDPYHELPRVGALPVAVIQSTNDSYVDAATARRRFGPDTPTRSFVSVPAEGHTFAGARDELLARLQDALQWVAAASRLTPHREDPS